MTEQERMRVLVSAEKAGLVTFKGGETEAYGGMPSAHDHVTSLWKLSSPEALAKSLAAMQEQTTTKDTPCQI